MPESYAGLEVAIVGMGKSNQALCRYLLDEGARLTCFDRKTPEQLGRVYEEFSQRGVKWSLGPDYLDRLPGFKYIFLTPGMKKHEPQIIEAQRLGAEISTEIDLFLRRCKGVVAGVTGSAGKTTTCMLLYRMLECSMPDAPIFLGGNIGPVLIEQVDRIPRNALVVLELSSFQLQLCTRSPKYALILNIRPNHLDIHKDFREYAEAKKNIFRFQSPNDLTVLNFDEGLTRDAAAQCTGRIGFYSVKGRPEVGRTSQVMPLAWLDGDDLVYDSGDGTRPKVLAHRRDLVVPGEHNVSNALGAIVMAMEMGATPEGIREAIRGFKGVEHRIEFVREIKGVRFYNDSIATSPDRTMALLDSLEGPLVLILGGYDKGLSFDELARKIVARGCKAVVMGQCGDKIKQSIEKAWVEAGLEGKPPVAQAEGLEQAVRTAFAMAEPEGAVALSPACASYDMFSNFEERGRRFKQIVNGL